MASDDGRPVRVLMKNGNELYGTVDHAQKGSILLLFDGLDVKLIPAVKINRIEPLEPVFRGKFFRGRAKW